MQLLMLALVDKEHEMPGSCWRIKMTPPETGTGQVVALPTIATAAARSSTSNIAAARRQPRSCIMQTSLVEAKHHNTDRESTSQLAILGTSTAAAAADERPRVKLILWKRELLVGTMELDASLRIRRAGPMAGLIMGRPPSALIKQPMYRFLPSIPKKAGWDETMGGERISRGIWVLFYTTMFTLASRPAQSSHLRWCLS